MGKKFYTTDNDDLYSLVDQAHSGQSLCTSEPGELFIVLTFGWTILLCPVSKMQELETTVVLELSFYCPVLALTTEKVQNMSSYWHRLTVIDIDLSVGWLVEHTDAAPAATANILPMLTKALNTVLKSGRKTQQI